MAPAPSQAPGAPSPSSLATHSPPAPPRRNWTPFLAGLAASVGLTALFWSLDVPGLFVFLLLPLLLWPRRRRAERVCPQCGHATLHPAVRYCPHDGTRMEHPSTHQPETS